MGTQRDILRSKLLSDAAAKFAAATQEPERHVKDAAKDVQASPIVVDDGSSKFRPLSVTRRSGQSRVVFGTFLYLRDLLAWNDALWKERNVAEIDLDFSHVSFFTPLSLLFIPHQIREFHRVFPEIRLHAVGYQQQHYAAHMGFFDYIGGAFGKTIGEAIGDRNYLPISKIDVSQFIRSSGVGNVRDAIELETQRLARVLVRTAEGPAFDMVQYSLREIIRNVFEHSGSKVCMYCAQYWPMSKKVQISIVDEGSGVHPSLTFNPKFRHLDERSAVQFSLFPGVSGNFRDLPSGESDHLWRNTGYGLYMTSRLCRNSGGFLIISSGHAVYLSKGKKTITKVPNFRGTLIIMDLTANIDVDFGRDLKLYAQEGRKIAENIQGANVIEASAASQLLSRDFAKAR